jgi:hypothetical protein
MAHLGPSGWHPRVRLRNIDRCSRPMHQASTWRPCAAMDNRTSCMVGDIAKRLGIGERRLQRLRQGLTVDHAAELVHSAALETSELRPCVEGLRP